METCHQALKKTCHSNGVLELLKSVKEGDPPEDEPRQSNQPGWYICGRCRSMSLPAENVYCQKSPCVTTLEFFQLAVLDMNMLSISIVNRSDVFADEPDYTSSGYQKAVYHQWVLWNHEYLGRTNRRVIPLCVVCAVRNRYPAPDRQFLGFKEY